MNLFRDEVVQAQQDRLFGEVVLRQSVSTRVVTIAIVAIVVCAALFVVTGQYARTEPARGVLVPAGSSSKIFALRPGVVSALLVAEGTKVSAGQKLAIISSDQPSGEGVRYTEDGVAALGAQERLAQERIGLAGERSGNERTRLGATLTGLTSQRANIQNQLNLQHQVVASARMTYEQIVPVVEKGFVSKLEVERRRQAFLNAQQQEAQLSSQLSSVEAQIGQVRADLGRLPTEQAGQIVEARSAMESYRQQKSRLEAERDYSIAAPIAGRVTAMQVSIGKTVAGQMPMMTIMPDDVTLDADVFVASRAIGFIRQGQEVRLLYDAFPYQRFGSFKGRIKSVSRVIIAPYELDAPFKLEEPVYKVKVAVDSQDVEAFGEQVSLQPGMTLMANIVLDRQSFWDWLTAPLRAVSNRS